VRNRAAESRHGTSEKSFDPLIGEPTVSLGARSADLGSDSKHHDRSAVDSATLARAQREAIDR